jgi:hypothetical protein
VFIDGSNIPVAVVEIENKPTEGHKKFLEDANSSKIKPIFLESPMIVSFSL